VHLLSPLTLIDQFLWSEDFPKTCALHSSFDSYVLIHAVCDVKERWLKVYSPRPQITAGNVRPTRVHLEG